MRLRIVNCDVHHATQELKQHAAQRLALGSKVKGPAKAKKSTPAIEVRLRLQDAAFVMKHHEMEVRNNMLVSVEL